MCKERKETAQWFSQLSTNVSPVRLLKYVHMVYRYVHIYIHKHIIYIYYIHIWSLSTLLSIILNKVLGEHFNRYQTINANQVFSAVGNIYFTVTRELQNSSRARACLVYPEYPGSRGNCFYLWRLLSGLGSITVCANRVLLGSNSIPITN